MKFKVGDIVRPTREFIINAIEGNIIYHLQYINGFQVLEIKDDRVFYYINEKDAFYKAEDLELVPEEPEFEYGDRIEVSNDNKNRLERMFVTKSNKSDYAVMYYKEVDDYPDAIHYTIEFYKYARKFKPQLTRKEIAKKFGIDQDFIFVDE